GVGKSTISVNLACGLATRHPERVLLLDASLQMGVCATMLDLQPEASLTDAAQERDRLDEVLLRQLATPHPCGLHLLPAPADALGFSGGRQRVILNRYSTFAGNLRPEDVARRLGREVNHVLPYEKKLLIAANIGQPYILGARRWFGAGLARALDHLVEEVDAL